MARTSRSQKIAWDKRETWRFQRRTRVSLLLICKGVSKRKQTGRLIFEPSVFPAKGHHPIASPKLWVCPSFVVYTVFVVGSKNTNRKTEVPFGGLDSLQKTKPIATEVPFGGPRFLEKEKPSLRSCHGLRRPEVRPGVVPLLPERGGPTGAGAGRPAPGQGGRSSSPRARFGEGRIRPGSETGPMLHLAVVVKTVLVPFWGRFTTHFT